MPTSDRRRSTTFTLLLAILSFVATTGTAAAQADDGWDVAIYPVLAWLPTNIQIDLNLPPIPDVPGSGGGARSR